MFSPYDTARLFMAHDMLCSISDGPSDPYDPVEEAPEFECECRDCGHRFLREDRVYLRVSEYVCENACPECGSTELDYCYEREIANELVNVLRDIAGGTP